MSENMSGDTDRRITGYIAAVASAEPAPGGGSVVATVAALAAGLCEMVCNLTIGRPAHAAAESDLRAVLAQATELRVRAEQLARDDEAAYQGYIAATKLPKTTNQEKSTRRDARQAALLQAAAVPLEVAGICLNLLRLLETTARLGNKHVLSDVEVATLLADAALHGALTNVRVNTRMLKSSSHEADLITRADDLQRHGTEASERVHTALASRTS